MTKDTLDLKDFGLRPTAARRHIVRFLMDRPGEHFSAEALHQQLQKEGHDIAFATVYRVLTQLEVAGLVRKHAFETVLRRGKSASLEKGEPMLLKGDRAFFEWDDGEHHDHLICLRCHTIIEFVDEVIESRQTAIASREGFLMTHHHLVLYGVCSSCSKKNA